MFRPFQIAFKVLCSKDEALLTTEVSFKFIMRKLSEKNTPLANSLKEILSNYSSSRRQTEIVVLLKYLHQPRALKNQDDEIFSPPSKVLLQIDFLKGISPKIFHKWISTKIKV